MSGLAFSSGTPPPGPTMAAMPAGRKEPGRDSPPDRAGSFGAECSPVGERWNGTEAVSSRAEGWRVGVVLSPAGGGAVRGYEEFGAGEGGGELGYVLLKAMSFVFELI